MRTFTDTSSGHDEAVSKEEDGEFIYSYVMPLAVGDTGNNNECSLPR